MHTLIRMHKAAFTATLVLLVLGLACSPYAAKPSGSPEGSGKNKDDDSTVLVDTLSGPIIGYTQRKDKKTLYIFEGIPYAMPPLGDLRFKPPIPIGSWTEPIDATKQKDICPQVDFANNETAKGSEDCLYINIITPEIDPAASLPVLFWIHGGNYTSGSNALGNPLAIARGHFLLVTAAYRLGALGFMSHPALTAESPHNSSGNYGLFDQLEALYWVQNNIEAFGGDPNNIILGGFSAGGASTAAHLASPLTTGLFQKAIVQSPGLGSLTLAENEAQGIEWAAKLDCTDIETAAQCLRAVSVDEFIVAQPRFWEVFDLDQLGLIYAPVVDNYFLDDDPQAIFDTNNQNDVPILLGTTTDEMLSYEPYYGEETALAALEQLAGLTAEEIDAVKNYYETTEPAIPRTTPLPWYVDAVTDFTMSCPVVALAKSAAQSTNTIYHYIYGYELLSRPAEHGSDTVFLAPTSKALERHVMTDTLISLWSSFINGDTPSYNGFVWPVYTPESNASLVELDPLTTITNYRNSICTRLGF